MIIEFVDLLCKGNQHQVCVRSKDGMEGNGRAAYVALIFPQRVAPFFTEKDARQLENHLWELYRWRSNNKLQGLDLCSPVA